MAIDPRMLSVERWTAETTPSLLPLGFVPASVTESSWRQWADSVKRLPSLGSYQIPDPRTFQDWREWGFRLNEVLFYLGL